MKIFFAGDLSSPFIQDDLHLLQEDHQVYPFNLPNKKIKTVLYPFQFLWDCEGIHEADLVWAWFADYPVLPVITAAKLFHKPSVVNIGGFEVSAIPEINYGNQLKTIRGAVSRWILRNASEIIVPSYAYDFKTFKVGVGVKLIDGRFALPTSEEYYDTHTMGHISMIPNWIDTSPCDKTYRKEELVITSVCSPSAYAYKGIPMFKKAVGITKYRHLIIENLPRAEYERILERAKVYCQFSIDETFGISLVEAMARGCVPVVTDRGAFPWIVQDTGIIVPYGDPITAAEAICRAMTMDGKAAQERARYFSRDKKQIAVRDLIKSISTNIY